MPKDNTQERILVIKLSALGDFIQAMGPMAAIRRHHPNAHITLLTTAPFEKFAQQCGYFDAVALDARPKWFQFGKVMAQRQLFSQGAFDRVYDLQNNDRTGFYFSLFPQGHKPEWVGIAAGASHRNTDPTRTAGHAFDGHVQTLALAGITDVQIDRLEWMTADLKRFPLHKPYIVLVPGSAPDRPEKRWPADHYGRLANMLNGLGYQVVLIGTKAEQDVTNEIMSMCPEALDLNAQTSLYDIAELGRNAVATIGNDTGPMHLIGATGCPCLVIFSSHSDPVRHAPKGEAVEVVQVAEWKDLSAEVLLNRLKLDNANMQSSDHNVTVH